MNRSLVKNIGVTVIVVIIAVMLTGFRYDFFEIAKQIEIYNTLFKEINMSYVDKTDPAELMEDGVNHMLSELDPYTIYSSEQDVEDAKIYHSGVYVGIGAKMKIIDSKLFIEEPFKGFSADNAGLKAGDEIIKINDIALSDSFQQAEILLNGKKNSPVKVVFKRGEKEKEVELIRGEEKPKAVPLYQMLENDIGYIALERFTRGAAKEVEIALKFLLIDEAKGLIIDLRNNPGGLLQEAVELVNLFVPKNQLVVSTRSNIKQYNTQFFTQKQPMSEDIPLVILINERSASASEIVAGVLQDLDRAVIVGNRSFGKGLVQQTKPLPYGAQVKITISRYFIPSGRCIQALNYGERSENGKAQKSAKEDLTTFKTKNGRTVFDGGGIEPDITTDPIDKFDIVTHLKKENLLFDFVTEYCRTNSITELENFELDAAVFEAFKTYCFSHGFTLNTSTERHLKHAFDYSKEEGLESISSSLKSALKSLEKEKELAFNQSKKRILWCLSEEIIKRNFYREGMYQFSLLKNNAILKSKSVLKDPSWYYSLLK